MVFSKGKRSEQGFTKTQFNANKLIDTRRSSQQKLFSNDYLKSFTRSVGRMENNSERSNS